MSTLVVLVVGLLAGIVARRTGRAPEGSQRALEMWVLDVALPALVLRATHEMTFPADVGLVVAAPYALFAVSSAGYLLVGRMLRMRRDVVAALVATTAVANTSFVGIPMVTAFFGADAVPVAVLVDQLGSFILLGTVVTVTVVVVGGNRPAAEAGSGTPGTPGTPGISDSPSTSGTPTASEDPVASGSRAGAATVDARRIARGVLTAPPLLALLAGLALRRFAFPDWLLDALAQLGATLTPIALFAVGVRLRFGALRAWRFELLLGLAAKLLAVPAIVVGLYALLGVLDDPAVQVALFEIAMPPMVAGSIMATRYGLAGSLPSMLVGVGVPLSLLTAPAWSWLLQR